MRIYLDTCILQDLKNENNKDLLDSIIQSKGELIYCFSEAHLSDLSRDKTDEKYSDMQFMEQIVDDNCYYYDKQILVDNFTPVEYYNRFDWTSDISANELMTNILEDDAFGGLLKSMLSLLSSIPLNFKELIPQSQLPDDMPSNMKNLFDVSNMGEWMSVFTNYSDALTIEQKAFKEQLQYLHKNQITNYLNSLGIEGYDGKAITDKEKFRSSYAEYYLKNTNGKGKYRYDLFTDMYSGLEFFGFVQGKPKKQKMMNMLNDSKHAFFGGFCDIVVSKDEDFINKTKFMYNLHEIDTQVFNLTEFADFLHNRVPNKSFQDLITELKQENIIYEINENEQHAICQRLSDTYYGYFNALINHSNGNIYFTKENNLFGTGTLFKEISYCVNQLIKEFGVDYYSKGKWVTNELEKGSEKEWQGRTWLIDNSIVVDLKFTDRLYIILGMAKNITAEKNGI
jgi:hypothetical protein